MVEKFVRIAAALVCIWFTAGCSQSSIEVREEASIGTTSTTTSTTTTSSTTTTTAVPDTTPPPADVFSFIFIDGGNGVFDSTVNFNRTPAANEINRIVFRGNTSADDSGSAPANCSTGTLLHQATGPFSAGNTSVNFALSDTIYYHIRVCLYDDANNETTSNNPISDSSGSTNPTLDHPFESIINMYSDGS